MSSSGGASVAPRTPDPWVLAVTPPIRAPRLEQKALHDNALFPGGPATAPSLSARSRSVGDRHLDRAGYRPGGWDLSQSTVHSRVWSILPSRSVSPGGAQRWTRTAAALHLERFVHLGEIREHVPGTHLAARKSEALVMSGRSDTGRHLPARRSRRVGRPLRLRFRGHAARASSRDDRPDGLRRRRLTPPRAPRSHQRVRHRPGVRRAGRRAAEGREVRHASPTPYPAIENRELPETLDTSALRVRFNHVGHGAVLEV